MGTHTEDEPLPRGYLDTSLTASLCPDAHINWNKVQLTLICKNMTRISLPPHIKESLLIYGAHAEIKLTHCLMSLSPIAGWKVVSVIVKLFRKIWSLPAPFPKAGLHARPEELDLNIPTVWEDDCGAAIRSCT
jgi:hypothetical protein